jgi:hypothetical protein
VKGLPTMGRIQVWPATLMASGPWASAAVVLTAVAGQQPQHPAVPLLQVRAAAHPAASPPARPSLARTTRAVAARSSASAASARRPSRVSR